MNKKLDLLADRIQEDAFARHGLLCTEHVWSKGKKLELEESRHRAARDIYQKIADMIKEVNV